MKILIQLGFQEVEGHLRNERDPRLTLFLPPQLGSGHSWPAHPLSLSEDKKGLKHDLPIKVFSNMGADSILFNQTFISPDKYHISISVSLLSCFLFFSANH